MAAVDRVGTRTGKTAWAWAVDLLPRLTCIPICTRIIQADLWVTHMAHIRTWVVHLQCEE